MRRNVLLLLLSITLVSMVPCNVSAAESVSVTAIGGGTVAEPASDVYEWHYQLFSGVLYKRLYNVTTDTWIGGWIKV